MLRLDCGEFDSSKKNTYRTRRRIVITTQEKYGRQQGRMTNVEFLRILREMSPDRGIGVRSAAQRQQIQPVRFSECLYLVSLVEVVAYLEKA